MLQICTDDQQQIYQNQFYQLLKADNVLPVGYCKDILFKYGMNEQALQFLFYRKEYEELLDLIKIKFESAPAKDQKGFWLKQMTRFCKKLLEVKLKSDCNEEFVI
jgi:hypothetical protein